jgi:hypothetical protein
MTLLPIRAFLLFIVLAASLMTGCGSGGTDNTIEKLANDPEALKEAHRKCRLKLEGADEKYCRQVAEAANKRFLRDDRKDARPAAPATESPTTEAVEPKS